MGQSVRLATGFRIFSRVTGVAVMLAGALLLVLDAVHGGAARLDGVVMQPHTALAFTLAGFCLLSALSKMGWARRILASLAAGSVAAIGGLHFGAYLFRFSGTSWMEPETAFNFVLLGLALLALVSTAQRKVRLIEAFTVPAILVALVALFGYAYSVKSFFGVTAYTKMTPDTLVVFLLLAIGIVFANPEQGLMAVVTAEGAGGVMARRLFPAVICVPIGLGWLTLWGEQERLYNGKFGLSLFVLSSIMLFVSLILVTYRSIDRTDRERTRLAAILLEEAERRHIARELHDEIGQSLTALKLHLETAAAGPPIDTARGLVAELMRRVSNLSLDLRPAMLDDLGLLPALLWLIERYQEQTRIVVKFEHEGIDRRFLPERETAAFRIVQEALTNVARHAEVKEVTVRVWAADGLLGLNVEDRGRGFQTVETMAAGRSSGLIGMRERAAMLGGQLTVESSPGSGVRIVAELPLAKGRAQA